MRQLKQESGKPNFRLGVKSRGCNGMSYTLDFADKPEKFEDVVSEKGSFSPAFSRNGCCFSAMFRIFASASVALFKRSTHLESAFFSSDITIFITPQASMSVVGTLLHRIFRERELELETVQFSRVVQRRCEHTRTFVQAH